jgi:hypothetical protein
MTSTPRAHLPPRLLPVLCFGAAHVALALAFGVVALDPRGVSGFFYHSRMLGIVHLVTLGWITASTRMVSIHRHPRQRGECAPDPDESCRLLRFLADQGSESRQPVLPRYDRKPKRLATRRLFVLQGLPGIGPELARRLLSELGSVARVMTADTATLERVRGVGPKKAARIRELVDG